LAVVQGEYDAASSYYDQALAARRTLDDAAGQAEALHQLGVLAQLRGDAAMAQDYYEEAQALRAEAA
jgi:tetratricopeptide (TPR) repeat protein